MEIRELLARLDQHRGSFPEPLVAEAVARREELIPVLLETLEAIDSDPEPWLADQGRMVHIHAIYLLALFRETRAYPLLVRIFSRSGEFPFDLAGDVVTQDLGRILASVSGGDVSGMAALIENEQANEYVRSVALDGMVSLVATGQRARDDVMAYFLQLFQKLERNPGAHWDGLANVCADLWPEEAIKELRRAYEDGLVDSIDWQDLEDALEMGKQAAMQRARYREPLITDVAEGRVSTGSRVPAHRFAAPRRRLAATNPALVAAARNSRNAVEPTGSKGNQSVDGRLVRVLVQSSFNPVAESM